jgi:hypothetical protein
MATVYARQEPKHVIEGAVLQHEEDEMLNWIRHEAFLEFSVT